MKVYYVAGEKSGDQLALWHVKKHWPEATIRGIGGSALAQVGTIDFGYDQFSCLGSFSILWSLPRIYFLLKKIVGYIIDFLPDQVVLVNFSQPNLLLAKMLKKRDAKIKIIFFSPPQLWIWGSWRIKIIKKYVDQVEVIFPFEVEWYQARGVNVVYYGTPVFDRFKALVRIETIEQSLLCLPGSRKQELAVTLHLFIPALAVMQKNNPKLKILISSLHEDFTLLIEQACRAYRLEHYEIVKSDDLMTVFSFVTCALTKPGTNTLELAFAGIPTLVAYKIAWPLYFLARLCIKIPFAALPNLILKQKMFEEMIQWNCTSKAIAESLELLFLQNKDSFLQKQILLRSYFENKI